MTDRPMKLRLGWRDTDALITAVHSQKRVTGLTHNFYKYPARFSPEFARASIDAFSDPGDLVADPFVGGGTTLVESRVRGRLSIGTDISTLATFVSKTKTQVLSGADIQHLEKWFQSLPEQINIRLDSARGKPENDYYTRNLDCRKTWAIRKAIELALASAQRIRNQKREAFARCVILRTAQWALDGRREIPSVEKFRARLSIVANQMLQGAQEYATTVRRTDRLASANGRHRSICLNSRAEGLADYLERLDREAPKLVVTSPPYPGVHILYHRWQVRGGKETPAPFWIANKMDGSSEAFYLMHARRPDLDKYTAGLEAAFSRLSRVVSSDTTVIQLVAFSKPAEQLEHYLAVMARCGFREYQLSDHLDTSDGRLWRDIPGRKWHANKKGDLGSDKEVVLIHKLA